MVEADFQKIISELVTISNQDESLVQLRSQISANQYLRLYRMVNENVKPKGAVLDWGSGNGHFSYFLGRSGYQTSSYGFGDIPEVCKLLEPNAYEYKKGDVDNPILLPYENETFDAVVSVGVLEHVRETGGNESASLKEIHRILKPNGVFICFHLPNKYSWIEMMLRLIGRWSHQYRFTASQIQALSANTNYEMVTVKRYAILPRNIWWWGVPKKLGKSKKFANFYDRLDEMLSILFSPICQNYAFVAKKL